MDDKTALHTAARWYCLDRDVFTTVRDVRRMKLLAPRQQWPRVTLSPSEAFGEEMALGAILLEVERVVPDHFASPAELRAFLLATGQTVEVYPISNPTPRYEEIIAQTRQAFCSYIEGLSVDDLHRTEPLPYRQVLNMDERDRLWRRLERRMERQWGSRPNRWWHPLLTQDVPSTILVVREREFHLEVSLEAFHEALRRNRVHRVWRLRASQEMADQYEMDIALFEPQGTEEYWTSEEMDWVLYASHESSLAFAGDWLVAAVKQIWPAWEQHRYTDAILHSP